MLAETATALDEAGQWAEINDARGCGVYITEEARRIYGGRAGPAPYPLGSFVWSAERLNIGMEWGGGQFPLEIMRSIFTGVAGMALADEPGGVVALRERVDPRLHDLIPDDLVPVALTTAVTLRSRGIYSGRGRAELETVTTYVRIRDEQGAIVGMATISKPSAGMATLSRISSMQDPGHLQRLASVTTPGRRAAAVLFADLESSTQLSRRLSTGTYFSLVRRLTRVADECVVEAGGLVGSHAGDGVVAFFLAETSGSPSAAARSCIAAVRAMRARVAEVAERSNLPPEDLVLRFGLHWGANLYVGQIATRGRTEVTALGDQVNETARIEACATGGRALASKDLVEHLEPEDAAALDLDPDAVTYTTLSDLGSATDKARRDAPAVAVCEV